MSQTPTDSTHGLGRIGVWSMELRFGDAGQAREATAELDELGYGAVWTPGGLGGDMLGDMGRLLDAAPRIAIASGILNIWKHETADVGTWWQGRSAADHARLMLGLGVSHGPTIGEAYKKPLAAMGAYLDGLDAAGVPAARRCLAALGPKMLDLSRERTAGAHPYLITPSTPPKPASGWAPARCSPRNRAWCSRPTRPRRGSSRAGRSAPTCGCPTTGTTGCGWASPKTKSTARATG